MLSRAAFCVAAVAISVPLLGQAPPAAETLNDLRLNAELKTTAWFDLHKTMEGNLSRLLPCDVRSRATIEAVTRASDSRLEAWTRYLQAWQSDADVDIDKAKRAIANHN